MTSTLSPDQLAHAFLRTTSIPHHHLVLRVGGSHAHGTAGPSSDVNVLGVHIAPTAHFLGLQPLEVKTRVQLEKDIGGVLVRYESIELGQALAMLARGDHAPLDHLHGGRRGSAFLLSGSSDLLDVHKLSLSLLSQRIAWSYIEAAHEFIHEFNEEVVNSRALAGGRMDGRIPMLDPVAIHTDYMPSPARFIRAVRLALTAVQLLQYRDLTIPLPQLLKEQRPYLHRPTIEGIEKMVEVKREGRDWVPLELAQAAGEWFDEVIALAHERRANTTLPSVPSATTIAHVNERLVELRVHRLRG